MVSNRKPDPACRTSRTPPNELQITWDRLNKEIKRRADVVEVFRTRLRSYAWPPPWSSKPTTNGKSPAATCCLTSPWPNYAKSSPTNTPPPNQSPDNVKSPSIHHDSLITTRLHADPKSTTPGTLSIPPSCRGSTSLQNSRACSQSLGPSTVSPKSALGARGPSLHIPHTRLSGRWHSISTMTRQRYWGQRLRHHAMILREPGLILDDIAEWAQRVPEQSSSSPHAHRPPRRAAAAVHWAVRAHILPTICPQLHISPVIWCDVFMQVAGIHVQ